MIVAAFAAPPTLAGSVAVIVDVPGAMAVTLNVTDVADAAIATLAGTVAAVLLLDESVIVIAAGYADPRVTVIAWVAPTLIVAVAGVRVNARGVTVIVLVAFPPPSAGAIVAVIVALPGVRVVAENFALVVPAAIDTDGGTVATAVLLDARAMVVAVVRGALSEIV